MYCAAIRHYVQILNWRGWLDLADWLYRKLLEAVAYLVYNVLQQQAKVRVLIANFLKKR